MTSLLVRPESPFLNRTEEKRTAALELANDVRLARARMKQQLRDGATSPASIVRQVPPYARTMKVERFLLSLPGVGPFRVHRMLVRARISDAKTLGGLSDRQRGELAALLDQQPGESW